MTQVICTWKESHHLLNLSYEEQNTQQFGYIGRLDRNSICPTKNKLN